MAASDLNTGGGRGYKKPEENIKAAVALTGVMEL